VLPVAVIDAPPVAPICCLRWLWGAAWLSGAVAVSAARRGRVPVRGRRFRGRQASAGSSPPAHAVLATTGIRPIVSPDGLSPPARGFQGCYQRPLPSARSGLAAGAWRPCLDALVSPAGAELAAV